MTTLSQCEVCIYTMPAGGDRQGEGGSVYTERADRYGKTTGRLVEYNVYKRLIGGRK